MSSMITLDELGLWITVNSLILIVVPFIFEGKFSSAKIDPERLKISTIIITLLFIVFLIWRIVESGLQGIKV